MLAIYDGVFCGCSSFGMGVGMMFRFEWIFKGKNDFWLIFVVENDSRSSFCKHTVASKKIKYRICIPKSRNEFSRIVCFAILRIRNLLEINRIPSFFQPIKQSELFSFWSLLRTIIGFRKKSLCCTVKKSTIRILVAAKRKAFRYFII